MPALITHQLFAEEIFNNLPETAKQHTSLPHLKAFAQSHDLLYYYHTLNLKKTASINKFGNYAHKSNTQGYLIYITRHIKDLNLTNDPTAIAYLYGAISHYCLDSTMHPFIFYKTGCYNKNNPESHKYRNLHNQIERHIDAYFYEKHFHTSIKKLNAKHQLLPKIEFSPNLLDLINKSYQSAYNKEHIATHFQKGYHCAQFLSRFLFQDRTGLKRIIYSLLSALTTKTPSTFANYSYYINKINPHYLNLSHSSSWHHPCTNELQQTSIDDLYNIALKQALHIIKDVNEVLYNNKNYKDLIHSIPNLSYTTGLPITNNLPLKYFEF